MLLCLRVAAYIYQPHGSSKCSCTPHVRPIKPNQSHCISTRLILDMWFLAGYESISVKIANIKKTMYGFTSLKTSQLTPSPVTTGDSPCPSKRPFRYGCRPSGWGQKGIGRISSTWRLDFEDFDIS